MNNLILAGIFIWGILSLKKNAIKGAPTLSKLSGGGSVISGSRRIGVSSQATDLSVSLNSPQGENIDEFETDSQNYSLPTPPDILSVSESGMVTIKRNPVTNFFNSFLNRTVGGNVLNTSGTEKMDQFDYLRKYEEPASPSGLSFSDKMELVNLPSNDNSGTSDDSSDWESGRDDEYTEGWF